jgi:hypothetical protein
MTATKQNNPRRYARRFVWLDAAALAPYLAFAAIRGSFGELRDSSPSPLTTDAMF